MNATGTQATKPASIDKQNVVRTNRDTLYSRTFVDPGLSLLGALTNGMDALANQKMVKATL